MFGLDSFKGLLSDQDLEQAQSAGLTNIGAALLQNSTALGYKPRLGQILGASLGAGQEGAQNALKSILLAQQLKQQQEAMRQQQMQQEQRKKILGDAGNDVQMALAEGGGPTKANAEKLGRNMLDRMKQAYAAALYQNGDMELAKFLGDQIKENLPKYEKIGEGEQLINPMTGQVVAQGKAKTPTAVQEYKFAVSQGFPGTFQDFQIQQKLAGATNIAVNTGKQFSDTLAKSVAESAFADVENAKNAINTLNTATAMEGAIDKAVIGTAANPRLALLRLGQTIGVGGKDDSERLAATSQLVQGLAQTQLNVAQSNKGQGTFTDFERKLLAQAASGDMNMTSPELKSLIKTLKKSATIQYQAGKNAISSMKSDPNLAPIAPYLRLPDMPSPNQAQSRVIDFNSLPGAK